MDIETRVTKVEGDVEELKVRCAVAQTTYASKADLQEAKAELKDEFHSVKLELKQDMHLLEMRMQQSIHALEVRVEKALHAQTWTLLGAMFAMFTATITIVYYMTS